MLRRYLPSNLRTAIVTGGPAATVGAIVWSHVENVFKRPEAYAEAPPTISRALSDPSIGGPFAIMMFIAAGLLAAGNGLIALRIAGLVRRTPEWPAHLDALFAVAIVFEVMGLVGMIVLSQFTGDVSAGIHEIGSYMMFAGHACWIVLCGLIIAALLSRDGGATACDKRDLALMRGHPGHAAWAAVLSVVFLVIYLTRPLVPDDYFFLQRLVMSSTEMVLLIVLVAFVQRFVPLFSSNETISA